jgi:general secretion pathway protein J
MATVPSPRSVPWPLRSSRGFTLIELLVAIGILALMAVLSWRGLDGMTQTQTRLQQRADSVLALQAGLAQWGADLDALLVLPTLPALDWDGRALRLTRRSSTAPAAATSVESGLTDEAVLVVAWSRRDMEGTSQWLRWQSPPLTTRGDVQAAWAQAAQWAQNPGDALKAREVPILPLAQWQIFYFRGDAWSNPLSTAGDASSGVATVSPAGVTGADTNAAVGASGTASSGATGAAAGAGAGVSAAAGALAGSLARGVAALAAGLPGTTGAAAASLPQGVRLVLTLPPGQAISGTLTRDWVLPTLGGGKS